ncbi:MAG: hypothetical protein EKK40_09595 [Bradyrhizobiaceae bacterium]|nr:MAG: hypothetical protein EKK40_09595 [Bradyrhizobiaceae bacterium]
MLNDFADVHYEKTAIFINAKHSEQASHILISHQDKPIDGARVGLIALPFVRRRLALVRFGPFWRRGNGGFDPHHYRRFIAVLIDEYCGRAIRGAHQPPIRNVVTAKLLGGAYCR